MADHTLDWTETPPASCRGGAVSIGNFDGVHRGHASLLTALRKEARAAGGPAVALTFDPHPLELLRPGQTLPVLTTPADRSRLLHELGADEVLILHTTPDLLALSAAAFFGEVVQRRLAVRAMVEGVNFGFGHNREGNIDTLAELCRAASLTLTVVPPLQVDGAEVSSSRVRALLQQGAVRAAASLLGCPYRLHGTVSTGQRRGQTLGFPTANLAPLLTLCPGAGVYAVRAAVGRTTWPGAANIGPNPTFGEQTHKVEVHLIGFQGDLYGQPLAVDFIDRLRDTRPFGSVAELRDQLRRDVEQARQLAGT
jgi:riboflavin kinase/FMN adenylyltransferase